MTTPCGHTFCRECLIRSIDNTQSQCPMCKHSLQEVSEEERNVPSWREEKRFICSIFHFFFNRTYNKRKLSQKWSKPIFLKNMKKEKFYTNKNICKRKNAIVSSTLSVNGNISRASIPRTLAEDTETLIFEIPIFVCILALPHLQCPLHVFEPRYRLMMRRAVESESRTFGMCSYDERIEYVRKYFRQR